MAHQDEPIPNPNTNPSQTEGERWKSNSETIRHADRDENPERLYDDQADESASGISNRPAPDEISSQEALPQRGTSRGGTDNPDATRREGEYRGDDATEATMPANDSTLNAKI